MFVFVFLISKREEDTEEEYCFYLGERIAVRSHNYHSSCDAD